MGQFNLRVKIDTVADLLKKGNGTFQFDDLVAALGSKTKRARFAVCEARRAGTKLYAIREANDGKRGPGKIVAYTTTAPVAAPVAVKAPVVKKTAPTTVAVKPEVKKTTKKTAAAEPAPVVLTADPQKMAEAQGFRKMSLDEVKARLMKERGQKVA